MDPDNDGRIRYGDIVAATRWICANLKDASSILEQSDALKLSNINDATEEGKTLLTSAKAILKNLGKADSDEISVSDFADMSKIFANSAFNADGIITELSVGGNDALKNLFNDILSVSEPKKDRSGLDGIDADDINKFFAQTKAYLSWLHTRCLQNIPVGKRQNRRLFYASRNTPLCPECPICRKRRF